MRTVITQLTGDLEGTGVCTSTDPIDGYVGGWLTLHSKAQ